MSTKVILIGGPPTSGKSTLARTLARRLDFGCVSTDDLGISGKAMTTAESHPGLHSMDAGNHSEYFRCNSADWLVDDVLNSHAELWPAIESIIREHTVGYSTDPIIIEGMALWPERVAHLPYPDVVSFWLDMTEEDLETNTRERVEFHYEEDEAKQVMAKFIARSVLWNRRRQEVVTRLGLNTVDSSPTRSPEELAQHCIERFNL